MIIDFRRNLNPDKQEIHDIALEYYHSDKNIWNEISYYNYVDFFNKKDIHDKVVYDIIVPYLKELRIRIKKTLDAYNDMKKWLYVGEVEKASPITQITKSYDQINPAFINPKELFISHKELMDIHSLTSISYALICDPLNNTRYLYIKNDVNTKIDFCYLTNKKLDIELLSYLMYNKKWTRYYFKLSNISNFVGNYHSNITNIFLKICNNKFFMCSPDEYYQYDGVTVQFLFENDDDLLLLKLLSIDGDTLDIEKLDNQFRNKL